MYIFSFHQTLFGTGRRNTVYLKAWTEVFLPICCEVADTGLAQGIRGSPAQILEGRGNVGLVNVLKPFMEELIDGLLPLVSRTFCHSLPTGCCSWWSECSTCRPGGAAEKGAEAGSWLFVPLITPFTETPSWEQCSILALHSTSAVGNRLSVKGRGNKCGSCVVHQGKGKSPNHGVYELWVSTASHTGP